MGRGIPPLLLLITNNIQLGSSRQGDSSAASHVREAAAGGSSERLQSRKALRTAALTLYCEAYGQDEDLVPFLNRNVIAAGLHLRHFQDDLGTALLDKDGLVIVLVIGKKDCRNRVFP